MPSVIGTIASRSRLLFAAIALAPSAVLAQWSGRNLVAWEKPGAIVDDDGTLEDFVDHTAVMTGVTMPGALCQLGPSSYLIAGGGGGAGRIEWWTRDPRQNMSLRSGVSKIGTYFCGIAFDECAGSIFALDAITRVIWTADWNGQAALPATWTIWATALDVPEIATGWHNELCMVPGDAPGDPPLLYLGPDPLYFLAGTTLTGTPGRIVASPFSWFDSDNIPSILADQTTASEGGTTLKVDANAGSTVEVVDVQTDSVIGTATVAPASNSVVVPLSQELRAGSRYAARYSGTATNPHWAFECMRRYGSPGTMADGTIIRRVYAPGSAYIGNRDFTLMVGVAREPSPKADVPLTGLLGLAARRSSGDPVQCVAGGCSLEASLLLDAAGWLGRTGSGIVSATLAIPNEPSLIGTFMFAQFALRDGQGFVPSEIFGFAITPPR
jgi:hypothetical protein